MSFSDVLLMMFSAILVENFIFSRFYGCCPFLGVSEKPDTALGMGMAVTFVMTVSSAATWAVYHYLLVPFGLEYLRTVAFILVIAALVQFIEMFLRRFIPALYGALGIYLPLITTNCAVLGVALTNVQDGYNFIESVLAGFGTAVGYTIAIVLLAGIRSRIDDEALPASLKGAPIVLICAALMAIAFMGFGGLALS